MKCRTISIISHKIMLQN